MILLILLWGSSPPQRMPCAGAAFTCPRRRRQRAGAAPEAGLVAPLPMDLLTSSAVIPLGLVVNNAILLVHQTRMAEREGMSRQSAVTDALQSRMRPIAMTSLTSIFGMLPLMLVRQGAKSGGLATVIVGGMSCSTSLHPDPVARLPAVGEQTDIPHALRRRA